MAGAGFKTFTAGAVLPALDVNTYLMQQATMTFASTTARDAAITSPSEGMHAYITADDSLYYYDGSGWKVVHYQGTLPTWTPSLTQSGSVAVTSIANASYQKLGKTVQCWANFTANAAGTSGQVIKMGGLPIAAVDANAIHGTWWMYLTNGNFWCGSLTGDTTTTVKFISTLQTNYMGGSPSFPITSGDLYRVHLSYPIA